MERRSVGTWTAALTLALAACGDPGDGPGGDVVTDPGEGDGPTFTVDTVAGGLVVPWDLAFAPDGRVFVTERPGRIRVIENGVLREEPWATVDVQHTGEAGLMGIAVDPAFASNGHVYVLATVRPAGALRNQVLRLTDQAGRGVGLRVLVDALPSNSFHAGGAVDVGPDGFLYVTVGDAGTPARSQAPADPAGKLLRYALDGTPAPGNGVGGAVHALGLRNPQGLAWDRASGDLFASEHGPSGEGGRTGHDELNRLVPGGNYGWPEVAGTGGGGSFRDPLAVWDPAIAPSGLALLGGYAYLGALRGQHVRRVALRRQGDGWVAGAQEALYEGALGRVRAVVAGPDGALWITTSNRDGRGTVRPGDDKVLRLVPDG